MTDGEPDVLLEQLDRIATALERMAGAWERIARAVEERPPLELGDFM